MPWAESSTMDQKRLFIADYLTGSFSTTELCSRYGISRPTGYKWIGRFLEDGYPGLQELSRRPVGCPHRTPEPHVKAILELRRKHPFWGAKKLLRVLAKRHPSIPWPARATVSDLLKRHGLIQSKTRRRYPGHPGKPETAMTSPNEVWCADFKGEFKTGNGLYCYPLTVTDGFSRYLLECKALASTGHTSSRNSAFRESSVPTTALRLPQPPLAGSVGFRSGGSVWGSFQSSSSREDRLRMGVTNECTRLSSKKQRGLQPPPCGLSSSVSIDSSKNSTPCVPTRPLARKLLHPSTLHHPDPIPLDFHLSSIPSTLKNDL